MPTLGWFAHVRVDPDQDSVIFDALIAAPVHEPEYQFRSTRLAERICSPAIVESTPSKCMKDRALCAPES